MKPAFRLFFPVIVSIAWLSSGLFAPIAAVAQTPQAHSGAARQNSSAGETPSQGTQLVSIDFNNVDIGVFIKFISDLTKRNFVVDDKVRGKVTIISPGKITVDEAYKVFESVLEVYGYTAVKSGEITKIIPSPEARAKNIKTRLQEESGAADDSIVTQIIPLRYADPNEIKNLFTPLISRNSVIQAYPPTNTLIVTDVSSNIKRLLKILKAIDITGVGQQIALIPVEHASAAKLVTLLETIFKSPKRGRTTGEKEVTFVADERTNVIVALASEGDVENVRQLVKKLDVETPKAQGNIHVYYLENASAEDLVKVLQDIPAKGTETKEPGKPVAPALSSKVHISADKATNSLIITADPEDYQVLEAIIKKVDIPRAMVYIEALIMEVNVTKDFSLGTQWIVGEKGSYKGKDFVSGGGFQNTDSPLFSFSPGTDTTTVVPSLANGFSLGVFGEALNISGITFPSISAVINAYKKDSDVRILSTPQILTTDNQEAKIYVGENLPFQTTATVSSSSVGEVYNSFEYRDVGKTLKITPHISKDRMVRLTLSLEVTSLQSTTESRPTTLKRTVDTTAIVKDGHSVVLGGLIDDTDNVTAVKTPCLGDIPGFGYLFGTKAKSFDKSNLYVFLTPKVIQTSEEASKVASSKRTQIENLRGDNINLYERKNALPPAEDLQIPAPKDHHDSDPGAPSSPKGSSMQDSHSSDQPMKVAPPNEEHESASQPLPDQTRISSNQGVAPPNDGTAQEIPPARPRPTLDPSPAHSKPSIPSIGNDRSGQDVSAAHPKSALSSAPAQNNAITVESSHENERPGGEGAQGYTLQVASMQTAEAAGQLINQLNGKGYAAYMVRSEVEGTVWYRIRIGYFATKKDASAIIDRLKADQFNPILVKL
jgi:general secretion pathway protein D